MPDNALRAAQLECLKVFSEKAQNFALAGGTALELYYLQHRFSADLDFFSPVYDLKEIEALVDGFQKHFGLPVDLKAELTLEGRAKVRFYSLPVEGSLRPLKIDFVEDVLSPKPQIERFDNVRVYSAENIYLQKITAIGGLSVQWDETGREITTGRNAPRDVFDLYMLSKKIKALHLFLKEVSEQLQRRMVHWYRTFSREELKLAIFDLDIYDKAFDAKEMISYLEGEIKKFIREEVK